MELAELEEALRRGTSSECWLRSLAAFLESRDLCFGHGTDNASDEAYWLLRAQQGWRDEAWSVPPDPRWIPAVLELAGRRVRERKPLAYLLGEAWFAGLRFEVDERVLIPRSPLAELIERQFQPWCRLRPADRVLDIGAGSGCIAVAVAHHCRDVIVDATEASVEALAVARANVARHGLGSQIRLLQADLFPRSEIGYRLVVSNPPYVPEGRLEELPAEYAWEPAKALTAGTDGLACVERILARAPRYLAPDGLLILEVGEAQDAFTAAHPGLSVTWLEFERGGEGVFMLTRRDLTGYLEG